jgi:CRP/FNR family cyclic AMP-dependent transcriptional regulator
MTTAVYTPTFTPVAHVWARMNRRRHMSVEKLRALSNTPLFAGLTGKHLDMMGRITDRVPVDTGTTLMLQGRVATHMSIIIDGSASVMINGTEVAVLRAGDIIGELSMVDNKPASASVVTREASTVWHIARAGFIPLWENNPEMANPILASVVAKLRETNTAAYSTASPTSD